MVIEALEENVIALIRSSSTIESVNQCVNELVLNSLDAKSTAVAVRVNLTSFRIQVVDNGKGISRSNLEFVGQRYMTSKCHSLADFQKRLKLHGFRGEALANISKISQRVSITSREDNCEETYCKTIEGDTVKIESVQTRPSTGTTVTVEGFLSSLPVRQQCIKGCELDNIKKSLENLIIIYPKVSFSLRNDSNGKIILNSVKCSDITSSFKTIHPEIDEKQFVFLKVSKHEVAVEGLIHQEFTDNKRLQYVYVNKRPISCPKIQNVINSSSKRAKTNVKEPKKLFLLFVIHIKCPYSDIDLNLEPSKTVVFFKKFDTIRRCIEKMMNAFFGSENVQPVAKKTKRNDVGSEFGLSLIGGAIKGLGLKRKNDEPQASSPSKSLRIIEETPHFEEEPKALAKQTTKPALPIEIKRSNNKDQNYEFDDIKDNSLYTHFPDNEKKGKDIIMDLFIKSVQVFPSQNEPPETLPPSPVKPPSPVLSDKVTLGIQTTLIPEPPDEEKMVSVGIQAGPSSTNVPDEIADITFMPRKSMQKFVSDYDFDFSSIEDVPQFNFHRQFGADLTSVNLEQTRKLFDFQNKYQPEYNIFRNYGQNCCCVCKRCDVELTKWPGPSLAKAPLNNFKQQEEIVQKSPYFAKKSRPKFSLSLKRPNKDVDVDTTSKDNLVKTLSCAQDNKENKIWNVTTNKKNKTKKNLNESTISKYFTPQRRPKSQKLINFDADLNHSKDLFFYTGMSHENEKTEQTLSNMVITVNDKDKEKIIESDLQFEKQMMDHILTPTLTLSQNNWVKEVNNFGSTFYTHKKTGVKMYNSPKKDITFDMAERFDFVPKGLSPILKDFGKVDELSPEGKEHLQNAVIESYEDELLTVKWQNYIDNKDPKKFFEKMYLEKSKLIESNIPSAAGKQVLENMSFTRELFKNIEVIGQVDCKFIAVLEKSKNLILLFDQHAVHERVRLEQLSDGYKNASTKVEQDIMIFLPHNDLNLLKQQQASLNALGLIFNFFTDAINIQQVPLCIYNKYKKGGNLISLTETLIKELIDTLKNNNGILVNTPRVVQNIVNSEACRGAVKFGDSLTKTECFIHLKSLAECNLPFQCAHGRPTLTPLISLNKFHNNVVSKPRLSNLIRV